MIQYLFNQEIFLKLDVSNNEGWEFIPNGTTQYTINQINYVPIIVVVATWYDNLGNIIGTGSTISVNPTVSTTYYCDIQGSCIDSTITNLDSVTIDISGCFTIDVESDSLTVLELMVQ